MIQARPTVASTSRPPSVARFAPAEGRLLRSVRDLGIRGVSTFGAAACRTIGPRVEEQFGILLYHRITDHVRGIRAPSINVTPSQFERQILGLLRQGYVFWPLRRVQELLGRGDSIPPQVVVLTFDDGFESVYQNAWPLLRRLNLPATIFLATAYLGSDLPLPFDHWGQTYSQSVPPSAFRSMTISQCRELADSGLIELGAHTHTHEDFRGRADDFQTDLQTNVAILHELFGCADVSFAFPYGTPRLGFTDAALTAAARAVGVRCALTTRGSLVKADDSPFAWGRFTVFPWDNGATLAAKLGGWYSWGPELKNSLLGRTHNRVKHATGQSPVSCPAPDIPQAFDEPSARVNIRRPPKFISVIVPTYNRAAWLAGALDSLTRQRTDGNFDFEIVVCDNASADDTPNIVASVAATSKVHVRYCYQSRPGDAPARNFALQYARGSWLAFFDDDQLAPDNWLAELVAAADKTNGQIIGGAVQLDLPARQRGELGALMREALRETELYPRLQPYQRRAMPGTGNALVARSVFESIGAFDESFLNGGSDHDFFARARAAGFALWYTPDAVVRHRVDPRRLTVEYLRRDALSGGSEHAEHVDFESSGWVGLLAGGIARAAQAFLLHLPLLLAAWLRNDRSQVLGRRVRLWRTEGYLRKCLTLIAPRLFPQQRFFASFRCRHGGQGTNLQHPKVSP